MTGLFDLTGRRALVTGGGSGIGLAMARALADHGAAVSLCGRTMGKVQAAAAELAAGGAVAHAQQVDVSDETAVVEGVREAVDVLGGLDVVVVNAGLAALSGAARNHAYGASKAGLTALVRSAAVELARYGVRVNGVLPGWTATDMTATAQASAAFTDRVIGRVPLGRWGRPEEFGGVAVYLAADASSYQTGTTVLVDGGYAVF